MKNNKYLKKIIERYHGTLKNKLCALTLLIVGVVPVLMDKDATVLVFSLLLGVPLFFAKENWIE